VFLTYWQVKSIVRVHLFLWITWVTSLAACSDFLHGMAVLQAKWPHPVFVVT
jgi:hypothetical protein